MTCPERLAVTITEDQKAHDSPFLGVQYKQFNLKKKNIWQQSFFSAYNWTGSVHNIYSLRSEGRSWSGPSQASAYVQCFTEFD